MGHHCCSKQKVKRGLWSPEEDEKLATYITNHGHGSWSSVPKLAGLQRCGKSCRLRWINYLRPDLKRGSFTQEEERTIIEVHRILGNRWAQIAKHLPGRTDNEVKNFWNSCIKKKLIAQGLDPNTHNLLPSHQKNKSKSNNASKTTHHPRIQPNTSSLVFSIDQTHDNVVSNTKTTQTGFSLDSEIELQNIDFSCIYPKNTQINNTISDLQTQFGLELNGMMQSSNCVSLEMNNNQLCDYIVDDDDSTWRATLANLDETPRTATQVFQPQQEIISDQNFDPTFDNSYFNCGIEGYSSTLVSSSVYGDIGSIMEQVAWGNC